MFKTCSVRLLAQEDLPMVLAWRNHPQVRRYMLTQHEISFEEHQAWFLRASQDRVRQLLIVQDGKTPLGFVQFNNVGQGCISDWGFYVRPDAPKGSGRKIGFSALNHAFNHIGLHKVCGQAIDFNEASIGFHKKLGFQQEGTLRDQQHIEGRYHALICFGLLQKEWRAELLIHEY